MDWVVFLYSLLRSCPGSQCVFHIHTAIAVKFGTCIFTFYSIHLQCVVEGLEPVATSTKTLDQGIKQNLRNL